MPASRFKINLIICFPCDKEDSLAKNNTLFGEMNQVAMTGQKVTLVFFKSNIDARNDVMD